MLTVLEKPFQVQNQPYAAIAQNGPAGDAGDAAKSLRPAI